MIQYTLEETKFVLASSTGNGDLALNGRNIILELRGGQAWLNPTASASSTTNTSALIGTTTVNPWLCPFVISATGTLSIRATTTAKVQISYTFVR